MKDKHFIIGEIQRIAALNGGKPPGQVAFSASTGIAEHKWRGVYWARWGDALIEAGFEPLEWNAALDEAKIIEGLIALIRKYRRFPTASEMSIEKRTNAQMPGWYMLRRRFSGKAKAIEKIREHCSSKGHCADVLAILSQETVVPTEDILQTRDGGAISKRSSGYVYLVKSGKLYKIGCSENHWRRKSELHNQTSQGIKEIHTIVAIDDPQGIERYWHERFATKRQHGEWFDLSPEDVGAFKKRKFM
jgi:hypothetical protein